MPMLVKYVPALISRKVEIINLDGEDILVSASEKLDCALQLIRTPHLTKTNLVILADDQMLARVEEPNARAMTITRSANMIVGDIIIVAERYTKLRVPTGILLPYPYTV